MTRPSPSAAHVYRVALALAGASRSLAAPPWMAAPHCRRSAGARVRPVRRLAAHRPMGTQD